MNIVVCIKQVPNTTQIKIDPVTGVMDRTGIPSIMNPDDKVALEYALRIKDEVGGAVYVVSMGPMQAKKVLYEAIAMGADKGFLLSDRAFAGADTLATRKALAALIKTIPHELIIAGRQAIDGDTAQVGPQIAEHLKYDQITYVSDVNVKGENLIVKRTYEDRYQIYEAKLPLLLTVLGDSTKPRYMNLNRLFNEANDNNVEVKTIADIDLNPVETGLKGSPTKVKKSFSKVINKQIELKEGTVEELAEEIVARLKSRNVL